MKAPRLYAVSQENAPGPAIRRTIARLTPRLSLVTEPVLLRFRNMRRWEIPVLTPAIAAEMHRGVALLPPRGRNARYG